MKSDVLSKKKVSKGRLSPVNRHPKVALHRNIAQEIRDQITGGKLHLGDKLPSQSELVKEYDVSVGTLRQSLSTLENEGFIRREKGRGSFVSLQGGVVCSGGKLRNFGLISEVTGRDVDMPAEMQVLKSFLALCRQKGVRLISDQTDFKTHESGRSLIKTFAGISLDGICAFFHNEEDVAERVRLLSEEFNAAVLFYPGPLEHHVNMDCVDLNLAAGMQQLMNYLLTIGHRRIAYVGPHLNDSMEGREWTTSGRWRSYRESLTNAGIPIDQSLLVDVPDDEHDEEAVRKAVINLVRQRNPATAVFAANDWMARKIMDWFWREDIFVPRDICLAGLDNIDFSSQLVPCLTTVALPFNEVANTVLQLIESRLKDPDIPTRKMTLNTELIIRDSTCALDEMKLKENLK